MRLWTFLVCFLAGAIPVFGNDLGQCPVSPKLTGPCFTVHGRLSLANGTWNHRIWPVGSRRMLAVVDAENRYDENRVPLPDEIRAALHDSETRVFADFTVCPLTPDKPGEMRHICLAGASKVFVQKH